MKTLIFCTSYSETLGYWEDRWGQWLSAIKGSSLIWDQILIVDDGSPILPFWDGVEIEDPSSNDGGSAVKIHHFRDRRGRDVDGQPFPGWYRSFSHAVTYGISSGFDRIIHIESDAYLLSQRAVEFFNTCDHGWVGLWSRTYQWPETTTQIINKDRFASCIDFFCKPYAAHLTQPHQPIEKLIPFTFVNKDLIGDRYGEFSESVPFGADYVSQVRWGQPKSYYWWIGGKGMARTADDSRPSAAAVVERYGIDVPNPLAHQGMDYSEFLRFLNAQLGPTGYLEIGTHQGHSVSQVSCDAICVDPHFMIDRNIVGKRSCLFLFQMASDDFFSGYDPTHLIANLDLGFLDGLHYFDALLKDFINFERHAHRNTIALLHDCLPLNTRMAGHVHKMSAQYRGRNHPVLLDR